MVGDGRQDGRYQVTHAPFPAPSHLLLATDALWWYNAASMQPRPTQPLAPVPLSRVCPGHGWLATCPRCVDQPSAFSQGAELLLRPAFNLGGSASLAFEDADHWTSRGAAARCQRWRVCPRIVHTGSTCCHARAERLYMPTCMQRATAQHGRGCCKHLEHCGCTTGQASQFLIGLCVMTRHAVGGGSCSRRLS